MSQIPAATNPSPKAEFLQSADNVTKHRHMVDLPEFARALHFAQLEYAAAVSSKMVDANSAMAGGLKISGAMEFCQVLRLLSETTQMPRPVVMNQLDHRQ